MKEWRRELDRLMSEGCLRLGEKGARAGCALFFCNQKEEYSWQGEQWFLPASNQKLWTSAVALERLGSDHRWVTHIAVDEGKLWVRGGGDPLFDGAAAQAVAKKLKSKGVYSLTGPLYWEDFFFDAAPWGTGWSWDDREEGYSAPVHGLNMEHNRITFTADPKQAEPCLHIDPLWAAVQVKHSLVWTNKRENDVRVTRKIEENRFFIEGELSRTDPVITGAVHSGPLFFMEGLIHALRSQGILLSEQPEVREGRFPEQAGLSIQHDSPPLSVCLEWVNGESDNFAAEVLLRTLGRQKTVKGVEQAGLDTVRETLQQWGITPPGRMVDGSGLSMYNLSSPGQCVVLLRRMLHHPEREVFIRSLPRYGVSGTLKRRDWQPPQGFSVAAKTGTLTGVKTLSGYLLRGDRAEVVFSLMINGLLEENNGEQLQDQFLQLLCKIMG
jgi:serine-type D-Ala-D-Ala carboxypeptidase/endopeptidase (penicillin-binding protein 4)